MNPSIVCGIDASHKAQVALDVARAVAERLGHRLVVVHAVPVPTPDLLLTAPARVSAHVEHIDLLGRDTGERLLSQAIEHHNLTTAEPRLERGGAAERLCAVAGEEDAELVVVGSRGAGTLHSAILGSVSTAIVRDAPCPAVVVPPGMIGAPLEGERIACGIDADGDGPAVVTAVRLARNLDVPLTLAHVLPTAAAPAEDLTTAGALPATFDQRLRAPKRQALRRMNRLLKDADADPDADSHEIQLRRGDPAGQLLELAAATRAMLLVVGSRGLGTLRAGLLGSVSHELVRRATRPVVICRHERQT